MISSQNICVFGTMEANNMHITPVLIKKYLLGIRTSDMRLKYGIIQVKVGQNEL